MPTNVVPTIRRSMLFVPGNRPAWIEKAIQAGPDSIILDLEDSIPDSEKGLARDTAAQSIRALTGRGFDIFVRTNPLDGGLAGQDIEAVVGPGLSGIIVPKIEQESDIWRIDALLSHFELKNGLAAGAIKLLGWPETASGIHNAHALSACCPHRNLGVVNVAGGHAGDVARSIGYRRSDSLAEMTHLFAHVLLANRAAGVDYPLSAGILEIRNLDAVRRHLNLLRDIGYRGAILIHPHAVAIANEVFSPTAAEIAWHRGVLDALDAAQRTGTASAMYQGMMIDTAHVKTARDILLQAKALGLETTEQRQIGSGRVDA